MSNKEVLKMVKQDGWALKYVKEQTPEICLEAVKQNGYVLRLVKKQTPEVCQAAVNQNCNALQYVKDKFMLKDTPNADLNKTAVMSIF